MNEFAISHSQKVEYLFQVSDPEEYVFPNENFATQFKKAQLQLQLPGSVVVVGGPRGSGVTFTLDCLEQTLDDSEFDIFQCALTDNNPNTPSLIPGICNLFGYEPQRFASEPYLAWACITDELASENRSLIISIRNAGRILNYRNILEELKILFEIQNQIRPRVSLLLENSNFNKARYFSKNHFLFNLIKLEIPLFNTESLNSLIVQKLHSRQLDSEIFPTNIGEGLVRLTSGNIKKACMILDMCMLNIWASSKLSLSMDEVLQIARSIRNPFEYDIQIKVFESQFQPHLFQGSLNMTRSLKINGKTANALLKFDTEDAPKTYERNSVLNEYENIKEPSIKDSQDQMISIEALLYDEQKRG